MIEILITSSVLITVIALLRLVLRGRIRPGLQYALWGLVLLRLLVPGSWFHSPVSVAGAAETAIEEVESLSARPVSELPVWFIPAPTDASAATREPSFWDNISLESLAIAIWITGAILLGLWFAYVNCRLAAKLYRERLLYSTDHPAAVYVVQSLPSPCLFGGEVYLTEEAAADPARAEYIIAHELTHRRHGDGLWSALRVCCLAVYWFNPFVWLAATLSRRDCEIFCDASTVKILGEEHRFDYGRTLLDMTAVKLNPSHLICSATTMSDSGRTLRERIRLIARQPKTSAVLCAAAVLIAAIAVGCTFSGAKDSVEISTPMPTSGLETVSLTEADAIAYYEGFLAANQTGFEEQEAYLWYDSDYTYERVKANYSPFLYSAVIAAEKLSDNLCAIQAEIQDHPEMAPTTHVHYVGILDGRMYVFLNEYVLPETLQAGLVNQTLTADDTVEHMYVDGSYYDEVAEVFGPFLEPGLEMQLDLGGGYVVGDALFDVSFEEFVYMTDSWDFIYYDEPIRLDLDSEGPTASFVITAKDGRELYIFSKAGLYVGKNWEYSIHVTLGDLTGDEMIAMLHKWFYEELGFPIPTSAAKEVQAEPSPIPDRGVPPALEEPVLTAVPGALQNVYPTAIPTPTPAPVAAATPVFEPAESDTVHSESSESAPGTNPDSTPAPIPQEPVSTAVPIADPPENLWGENWRDGLSAEDLTRLGYE